MEVNVSNITYKEYGKCLRVVNSVVEIIVTIEYGPRIIKYGYVDGKNHFAENIEKRVMTPYGDYYVMGGHRFCDEFCIPDNKKIDYEITPNGVKLIQNAEKWTQVQKSIEIVFEGNSSRVKIIHRQTSLNAFNVDFYVCGITSMRKGGLAIIPLEKVTSSSSPNKSFIFWPNCNLKDPRIYFGEKFVIMKVNEDKEEEFKIGFNTDLNYALYYNENEMFVKYVARDIENKNYPNRGSVYETLISKDFLEIQTNSPIYNVGTNEIVEHIEVWELHKGIEPNFIETFIDNH